MAARHHAMRTLILLAAMAVTSDAQTVNSAAVARRRAKKDAENEFLETHGASFDSYGRVIRYGIDVNNVECSEPKEEGGKVKCKVTEYERRKYLTSEEKILAKQIQADKQEELDGNFAEGSAEDTLKRHRMKKEQKARCRVFNDWLVAFQADASDKKKDFFRNTLKANYEDYAAMRALAERGQTSSKEKKKAKKLKRHIALNIHEDKLPTYCNGDDMKDMMMQLMSHMEVLANCIAEPHTCDVHSEF